MADKVKFTSNIKQHISGWNKKLANFKKYVGDAFTAANEQWKTNLVSRFLSGRPGLRNISGKAAGSWKGKVSISGNKVRGIVMSKIPGHSFNYIMAHEDPRVRNTAFGKPSKAWILPKRTDIFGLWQGEGGKRYFGTAMDILASKGVI